MSSPQTIPHTDLTVPSLCLGTNVFGWSITEQADANRLLDGALERGLSFIDTADMYVQWQPGNQGGESETMIGSWLRTRGRRDDLVLATKVGKMTARQGLHPDTIRAALEDSLRRLGTDYVDLYYAHRDDDTVPLSDVLGTFHELIQEGLIRAVGASNFTGARLHEAADIASREGFTGFVAVQNEYNLVTRSDYESDVVPTMRELGLAGFPFYALASGFLTGKYRAEAHPASVRASRVQAAYETPENLHTVDRLLEVALRHHAPASAVALEWLRHQDGVTAPIASARTLEQLDELLHPVTLTPDEVAFLSGSSV